jgi:hypothetical protein
LNVHVKSVRICIASKEIISCLKKKYTGGEASPLSRNNHKSFSLCFLKLKESGTVEQSLKHTGNPVSSTSTLAVSSLENIPD